MKAAPGTRPWYREPMLWLVIGLPASAVIAGTGTLLIALNSGGNDAVPDVVQRTLQIQNADLGADRRALQLGLHGELKLDLETGAVEAEVAGLTDAPPSLSLRLQHAGRASRDVEVRLVRAGERWLGRLPSPQGQAWNIELGPEDRSWRIGGRLDPGAHRSDLIPLLAGPG